MAFPFYPVGLITATLFLAAVLAVFRMLLLVLDRGAAELRGSIGAGLVRGVQAWGGARSRPEAAASAVSTANAALRANLPPGAALEELAAPPDIVVEAVHAHGR